MRVGVCGLGKLGTPLAVAFAASGVITVGYDVDAEKLAKLERGESPVDEPGVQDYLDHFIGGDTLIVAQSVSELVEATDACVFVTPTPSLPSGDFDHRPLISALMLIAVEVGRLKKADYVFIVASTVMPGFLDEEGWRSIKDAIGGVKFRLAYKPEFIALGTVLRDLREPDVLLIGANDDRTAGIVEELYRRVTGPDTLVKRMFLVEAELAKISLNCAVTARISFANQVGLLARRLNADPYKVLDAVGADRRVGHAVLQPGLPFGGPCFPRDNMMFARAADRAGCVAPMSHATDAINELTLGDIIARLPKTGDVGILGLAYKAGTSITEESAGIKLKAVLEARGRTVKAHDPRAPHPDALETVCACRTVIVACAWPEYQELTLEPQVLLIDPARTVRQRYTRLGQRAKTEVKA